MLGEDTVKEGDAETRLMRGQGIDVDRKVLVSLALANDIWANEC